MYKPASMTIALISDLFFDNDPVERLKQRLTEAKAAGAELAVLAELPLDPWFPAIKDRRDSDAELPNGRRSAIFAEAAEACSIGLVGGAVVRDPQSLDRYNTALVYASDGRLLGTYRKCHLPEQPGSWEASQYDPGDELPSVFDQFAIPFGIQICSDANRPAGSQILAAMGAGLVLVPRATEVATFGRWRMVFQANAITCGVFVASVTRPGPENGIAMGGPSVVVGPSGEVLLETSQPVATITIDRGAVQRARNVYPGSLPVRSEFYARAWTNVAQKMQLGEGIG